MDKPWLQIELYEKPIWFNIFFSQVKSLRLHFWTRHCYWIHRGMGLISRLLELETTPNVGVANFQKWAQMQEFKQSSSTRLEEWSLESVVIGNWWCRKIGTRAGKAALLIGQVLLGVGGRDGLDKCLRWCCLAIRCSDFMSLNFNSASS